MYTYEELENKCKLSSLREILSSLGGTPGNKNRAALISDIMMIQSGDLVPSRSRRGRPPKGALRGDQPKQVSVMDVAGKKSSVSGILEIISASEASLRVSGYLPRPDVDVRVPMQLVQKYSLRAGDEVEGTLVRKSGAAELDEVVKIFGADAEDFARPFDFAVSGMRVPSKRLNLGNESALSRVADFFAPVLYGQRCLVLSETELAFPSVIRELALSAAKNNPELKVISLLVGARPEDGMLFGEGVAETAVVDFGESYEKQLRAARNVFDRAVRLVESGNNVLVAVDSFSKLCRAAKRVEAACGIDFTTEIKKIFMLARSLGEAGLTVIAGMKSEPDDLITRSDVSEFVSAANQTLVISSELLRVREMPAVDVLSSGTIGEEKVLSPDEMQVQIELRRALNGGASVPELFRLFEKTSDNYELVRKLKSGELHFPA